MISLNTANHTGTTLLYEASSLRQSGSHSMSKKAASVNNRSGWLQKQEGTAWARTYTVSRCFFCPPDTVAFLHPPRRFERLPLHGWFESVVKLSLLRSLSSRPLRNHNSSRALQVLKGRDLSFYASDAKEERPYATVNLEDAVVGVPDISRVSKRHAIEVTLGSAAAAAIAAGAASGGAGAGAGSGSRSISSRIVLAADGKDEQEAWLQSLSVAAVPDAWPGGYDLLKRPQPLLYSLWLARNRPPAGAAGGPGKASGAAAAAAAAAGGSGSSSAALPATSPVPRLPALRSVPAWARKALLLRKFRLCSVTFDGVPSTVAGEEREAKRNTLLEILDWLDEACSGSGGGGSGSGGGSAIAPRAALGDLKFFEDMVGMLRATLFRTLPEAPPPSGDPEEEELPFADPQWGHLNVAYELLLRLVSADAVDLGFKKRVVDAPFVRSLLSLFDSEDARERDYLKVSCWPWLAGWLAGWLAAMYWTSSAAQALLAAAAALPGASSGSIVIGCLLITASLCLFMPTSPPTALYRSFTCADNRASHLLQAYAAAGAAAARRLPRLL